MNASVHWANVMKARPVQRLRASEDAGVFDPALTALNKFFVSVQTLDIGRPVLKRQAVCVAFPQEREAFSETYELIGWPYEVRWKMTNNALSNRWR